MPENTKDGDDPAASEDAWTGPTNVTFWKKKEKDLLNKKTTQKKLPFVTKTLRHIFILFYSKIFF